MMTQLQFWRNEYNRYFYHYYVYVTCTYTQYIWNVHKRILKEKSVIFDHVVIDYNHYIFRVALVN